MREEKQRKREKVIEKKMKRNDLMRFIENKYVKECQENALNCILIVLFFCNPSKSSYLSPHLENVQSVQKPKPTGKEKERD